MKEECHFPLSTQKETIAEMQTHPWSWREHRAPEVTALHGQVEVKQGRNPAGLQEVIRKSVSKQEKTKISNSNHPTQVEQPAAGPSAPDGPRQSGFDILMARS